MKLTKSIALLTVLIAVLPSSWTSRAFADQIILQSTTSTANSGLYEAILPLFREASGVVVHVVAVGTGQAIKNARNGDADVLLVHAKAAEEQFVANGFGVERLDVMFNDFIIVGPPEDGAHIRGMDSAAAALAVLSSSGEFFVSRGDDSGTHKKELELWRESGIDPSGGSGSWYLETGSGMGASLNVAIGKNAYVLTDRGTWLSFENRQQHEILVEGDESLFNQYGVILVNPEKHPHVNAQAGQEFINWITGPVGQAAIAAYKLNDESLFFPNAKR